MKWETTGEDVRKHFGYVIHDLAKLLRRHFESAAQHYELTLPQWRAIGQLSLTDAVSQVGLAALCDTDPMTISGVVERLESKGLVASRLGESTAQRGGRAKRYFKLTAEGVRQVRDAQRALEALWIPLPQSEGSKT